MYLITAKESIALSYIRVFAVILIVSCHYFQAYNNKWAYIFNLGVQLFFVLSGFLYGHKKITNWSEWYYRRFKKLYIPIFIFLTITFPLYYYFHRESLSTLGLLCNYLNIEGIPFVWGGVKLIPGTRHLWFMTAIALCYCITPFLQKTRSRALPIFIVIGLCQFLAYIYLSGKLTFTLSWFFLYSLGYMYANISERHQLLMIGIIGILIIVLLMNISWLDIVHYYNAKGRFLHDLLGCFILFGGVKLFTTLSAFLKILPIISIIDKYSFQIYIIHYFLLIGPFSLAHLTENNIINIMVSFTVIVISTLLFTKICIKSNKLLFVKNNEN